jgi:hypothetical protein
MMRLRSHLSYANVMATIAVFVALGGTSYAVTQLPRNSVGSKAIRTNAVGTSEIRKWAVRSGDIKDRSVALRHISRSARDSLRGQAGPAGPQGPAGPKAATLSAAVSAGAQYERSVGTTTPIAGHPSAGVYMVAFDRDISSCYVAATISTTRGNAVGGEIVTEVDKTFIHVRTSDSSGSAADLPFHVIVSC